IDYISLQPRLRPVFGTLTGISLATVCICFPLATVGYHTDSFNPSQIVGIAAISLVTNAILYKVFHERKFRIKGTSPASYAHMR
ncbi:MAG TPA: hypothetical protein VK890_09920, partial [Bacteroidia bacterium]|nr:hypothetical protein [Bacteroidia bacterium]